MHASIFSHFNALMDFLGNSPIIKDAIFYISGLNSTLVPNCRERFFYLSFFFFFFVPSYYCLEKKKSSSVSHYTLNIFSISLITEYKDLVTITCNPPELNYIYCMSFSSISSHFPHLTTFDYFPVSSTCC